MKEEFVEFLSLWNPVVISEPVIEGNNTHKGLM
jgi:hypothetical protein